MVSKGIIIISSLVFATANYKSVHWYYDLSHRSIAMLSQFDNELFGGGKQAIVYLNLDNQSLYLVEGSQPPYGIEGLNDLLNRQLAPYLRQKGFEDVFYQDEGFPYTGNIDVERENDVVRIYLR